jgi:dTDP-4-amino-4,6-dideoxygalactose transaminase
LSDEAKINRDQLIDSLFADGIGVSVHYIPLHLHPYWKERYDLRPEQFPQSQKAYERMVTLPLYTKMTDADVERVIAAVRKAFGKR